MWTRLATVALCLAGVAAHAQPVNDRLDSCIQAARVADTICSRIPDDPAQRADCFAKARATQLECLDRVLSEAPAETAPSGTLSETTRPAPPVETAAPEQHPAANENGRTDQRDVSAGSTPADDAAKPAKAESEPAPASPAEVAAKQPKADPGPAPASQPAAATDAPTGAIRSAESGTGNDRPAAETDWTVSETTSPVDYSPLVTASVRATLTTQGGPNTFTVRCRAQNIELSLQTNGTWRLRRGNQLPVDHQINDQPVVRLPWILSPDGKTATYRSDSAEFLRSIPDGATLKVTIADKSNARLAATFELTGLPAVRQKVGTACKWPPLTAKTSPDKP